MDAVYPDAGMAAIRLLKSQGVEVVFPQAQSCCGQPAYNAGFVDEAREVARQQLRVFQKPWPIVVPSGSCAGMMHCHYPELFAGDPMAPAVTRFSAQVFELSEYLRHVLNVRLDDGGPPLTVTWHSSCHAMREMGVTEDAKALIRQLKNVRLVELEKEFECCGFGGTFAVKQPALSAAMVQDKVADICQTGATRVISTDCGCLMNIGGVMQKQGLPIKGQHIAEFLWERINA
jgi:L-lactate dehydrogenase complex protein LldE